MAAINFDTANTGYGGNYGGGGYGYGGGYGGYCGNGILDIAALGLVFGDGFGRRGRGDDCCGNKCCEKMIDMHDHHDDHNHEVDEIHGVQMEVCAAERQMSDLAMMLQKCCCDTDKDVLEAKYDLGTQILESKFENALQGKDIIREIDLQSCGINRNIDGVNFKQAIFAKEAQAQLDACCCKLENKIRDSIDATNKTACDTQMLIIKTDAKNDLKDAERENRALERKIDQLLADKRSKEQADVLIANSGTITDSLNTAIANLGSTLTTA